MIRAYQHQLTIIRLFAVYGFQSHRIAIMVLLIALSFMQPNAFAQEGQSPPERADQAASSKGFSTWDLQFLYGSTFREPGINQDVKKGTATIENTSGWSWGSSYFFIDYLKSNKAENNATEFYGETQQAVMMLVFK